MVLTVLISTINGRFMSLQYSLITDNSCCESWMVTSVFTGYSWMMMPLSDKLKNALSVLIIFTSPFINESIERALYTGGGYESNFPDRGFLLSGIYHSKIYIYFSITTNNRLLKLNCSDRKCKCLYFRFLYTSMPEVMGYKIFLFLKTL